MTILPGILSTIIVICLLILMFTGWKELLFPIVSNFAVLGFILLWMLTAGRTLTFGMVTVDLAWLLWILTGIGCVLHIIIRSKEMSHILLLAGHIGILSALLLMIKLNLMSGYGLLLKFPDWTISLFLGCAAGFTGASVIRQWAVITLSLAIGEYLVAVKAIGAVQIVLGALSTFDEWWIAFVVSRMCVLLLEVLHRFVYVQRRE
ncbi:hypothetical protein MH117_03285 [Paenibacillus sp. ACRRX]|uniref:hypothetical protein n=1 Tax=Paenibacillus sp. ACRRX TaxID=2918206 RepID=UPI001EF5ABB1|nr:hypothetical protein [Paenibacillus sp. ACRRX]MCG7406427.1 hypothetical protein [Paenibacillus sp. ACRRX]